MTYTERNQIGLLIGAGSMGKRHAKVLIEKYASIVVVDRDAAIGEWVKQELRAQDRYFPDLTSALAEIGDACTHVTAIIATLGPHHFAAFNQLVDHGVRRILCEKPLSNSIASARKMVERATSDGVRLTVGLQRRRNRLVPQLHAAAEKYLGGRPVAIVGHGGAHCLITTGMHWIDLAIDLFEDAPITVSAVAAPDFINPRGKDLEMWAGVAGWSFSGGRYLSLTYSNLSSVEGMLHMYCPNGRLDVAPSGEIQMFERNADQIARDPRMTRVGEAILKPEFQIAAPEEHPTMTALRELDSQDDLSYSATDALISLEAAIGALISAQDKHSVTFPIIENDSLNNEWAIS
jgi:predicted dehydrogenase